MLLAIAFPLLFSVFIPATPFETVLAELQESHIKVQETPPYEVSCSCSFYTHTRNNKIPLIDAKNFVPNTDYPVKGGGVLFFYPNSALHHIAYIESVNEDGTITVSESNFYACEITSRTISVNEKRIIGFVYF